MTTTHTTITDHEARAAELGSRLLLAMPAGTLGDFERLVHPEAVNHEAGHEPPQCRVAGPAGFHASALWLRQAFADLAVEIHHVVAEGDLVVVHNTMSGRQRAPMAFYGPDGSVADVFPPRGGAFATTQTHWMRVAEGFVVAHWANRDDLGTARQLRWVPPTPAYLLRAHFAKGAVRRAARRR